MELSNRDELEAEFAARISRLTGQFRNRALDLIGNPPDFAKLDAGFWSDVENEMKRELSIALLLVFAQSAAEHGAVASRLEPAALTYSLARSATVANAFTINSRERFAAIDLKLKTPRPVLPVSPAQREAGPLPRFTPQELADEITKIFGPSRAESIAVTETTAAQHAGGESSVAANLGLEEMDLWITRRDEKVCPICEPLDRLPRSRWQTQQPSGPPAHPNCRCWIDFARVPANPPSNSLGRGSSPVYTSTPMFGGSAT